MTHAETIPHAHTVKKIGDPLCVTLYVETALVPNPGSPGFDAKAKQRMLMAIAELVDQDGLEGFRIVWSVPPPPAVTELNKASAA